MEDAKAIPQVCVVTAGREAAGGLGVEVAVKRRKHSPCNDKICSPQTLARHLSILVDGMRRHPHRMEHTSRKMAAAQWGWVVTLGREAREAVAAETAGVAEAAAIARIQHMVRTPGTHTCCIPECGLL